MSQHHSLNLLKKGWLITVRDVNNDSLWVAALVLVGACGGEKVEFKSTPCEMTERGDQVPFVTIRTDRRPVQSLL